MDKEKLVYLIDDKEYKAREFYSKLRMLLEPLSMCCWHEQNYYDKEFRRIKGDLLYGFVKTINGVCFKIKRVKTEVNVDE